MKRKFFEATSITLSLVILILSVICFASCNREPGKEGTESDETTVPDIPVMIVDKGVCPYRIVYPDGPGEEVFSAVRRIAETLGKICGEKIEYESDFVKRGEEHDKDAFEILVGHTDYEESGRALENLRTCDYVITNTGHKIVINAHNTDLIRRAVSYFCNKTLKENIKKDEEGKVSIVFSEFLYRSNSVIESFKLGEKELKEYTIIYPGNNPGYRTAANTLAEDIAERYGYLPKIGEDNSTAPSENEILLGPTARKESADFAAKHATEHLSYSMGFQNGKYVILGQPSPCARAVEKFASRYLYGTGKTVEVSNDDFISETLRSVTDAPLAEGADIRVMTANILAEFPSWSNTYTITPVDERIGIFASLIETYEPDVAGIQEVTDRWHILIPKYLGERYKILRSKTPHDLYNYSTILYDSSKYDVIDDGVRYFTTENVNNIRLVTWGVFQSKKNPDIRFSLFNTHWCWDCDDHKDRQSKEEAALVKEVTKKYPYPFFCTGDFNANGDNRYYLQFLELSKGLDAEKTARKDGTLINDSAGCADLGIPRGPGGNPIDHIVMSPECLVRSFETVLVNMTEYLSDHSPKYADVKLPN